MFTKSNVNTLIGNIKEEMPRLLTDDKEEIKQIVKEILDIARKRPSIHKKIKAPTNKERDKKKYYHKNANQTSKTAFKKMQNLNLTAMKFFLIYF